MATFIWFLDCGSGCVTKVKLSEKNNEELNKFLNEECGDMSDWLYDHEQEFGVNMNSSSWMITESDTVYEVDF